VPKWYRSQKNKMLFGVCGGIGECLGKDPKLIRFFCVLSILMLHVTLFAPVLIYIVLTVLLPIKEGGASYQKFYRSRSSLWILGICGGLAEYTSSSVIFWRLLFLLFTVLSVGIFFIAYLVFGYLFPLRPKKENTII